MWLDREGVYSSGFGARNQKISRRIDEKLLSDRELNLTFAAFATSPDHPTWSALALTFGLHVLGMLEADAHKAASPIGHVDVAAVDREDVEDDDVAFFRGDGDRFFELVFFKRQVRRAAF